MDVSSYADFGTCVCSLGLRSASTKTLLLLCDLFFVIFSSSNLSLAFDALYDHRWACYDDKVEIVMPNGNGGVSPIYNVPASCPNNMGKSPYIHTQLPSQRVSRL